MEPYSTPSMTRKHYSYNATSLKPSERKKIIAVTCSASKIQMLVMRRTQNLKNRGHNILVWIRLAYILGITQIEPKQRLERNNCKNSLHVSLYHKFGTLDIDANIQPVGLLCKVTNIQGFSALVTSTATDIGYKHQGILCFNLAKVTTCLVAFSQGRV
jgi:hypothetical protein